MTGRPDGARGRGPVARVRELLGLEIVRYGLVGAINTAFGYGLFIALQLTLGTVTHYLVVLVVSNVVSIVEAYVMQRWLVFRFTGGWWARLVRFSTVYLVALGVNVPLLSLLVEVVHLPVIPAQGIAIALQAFGTYAAHKLFTFRHRQVEQTAADSPSTSSTTPAAPAPRSSPGSA